MTGVQTCALPILLKLASLLAFLAFWLAACAIPQVLALDIVPRIAVGLIVIDLLLCGVPCALLSHSSVTFSGITGKKTITLDTLRQ